MERVSDRHDSEKELSSTSRSCPGLCLSICLALMLSVPTGCTPPACLQENLPTYSNLSTPRAAVQFLRYAVKHGCNERAYATLSVYTREKLGSLDFKIALWTDREVPGAEGIGIRELIEEASIVAVRPTSARHAYATIRRSDDFVVTIKVLEDPEGKWRIGLRESLDENLFYLPESRR